MLRIFNKCLRLCVFFVISIGHTSEELFLGNIEAPPPSSSQSIDLDDNKIYLKALTSLYQSNYLESQNNLERAVFLREQAYIIFAHLFEKDIPMVFYHLGLYYLHGLKSINGEVFVQQDYGFARHCFCQAIKFNVTQAHILAAYCCQQLNDPLIQNYLKPLVSKNNQPITLVLDPHRFGNRSNKYEKYLMVTTSPEGELGLTTVTKESQPFIGQSMNLDNDYYLAQQHYQGFKTLKESQKQGRDITVTTYNLAVFYRYGLPGFENQFVLPKDAKLYQECLESLYALGVPEAAVQLAEYYLSDDFEKDNKASPNQCQEYAYTYLKYAHQKKCYRFKLEHAILNEAIYYQLNKEDSKFTLTVAVGDESKIKFYVPAPVVIKLERSIDETMDFINGVDKIKGSGRSQVQKINSNKTSIRNNSKKKYKGTGNRNKNRGNDKSKIEELREQTTVEKAHDLQSDANNTVIKVEGTTNKEILSNNTQNDDNNSKPFLKVLSKRQQKKQRQAEREAQQQALKWHKNQGIVEQQRKKDDEASKATSIVSQSQAFIELSVPTTTTTQPLPQPEKDTSKAIQTEIQQPSNDINEFEDPGNIDNNTEKSAEPMVIFTNRKSSKNTATSEIKNKSEQYEIENVKQNYNDEAKEDIQNIESFKPKTPETQQSTLMTSESIQPLQQRPQVADVDQFIFHQNDGYDSSYIYPAQPADYNNYGFPNFNPSGFTMIPQVDLHYLHQQFIEQKDKLRLTEKNFHEKAVIIAHQEREIAHQLFVLKQQQERIVALEQQLAATRQKRQVRNK